MRSSGVVKNYDARIPLGVLELPCGIARCTPSIRAHFCRNSGGLQLHRFSAKHPPKFSFCRNFWRTLDNLLIPPAFSVRLQSVRTASQRVAGPPTVIAAFYARFRTFDMSAGLPPDFRTLLSGSERPTPDNRATLAFPSGFFRLRQRANTIP